MDFRIIWKIIRLCNVEELMKSGSDPDHILDTVDSIRLPPL